MQSRWLKQLFGSILLAVGILIAGTGGLCSLWVLFSPGEYGGMNLWQLVLVYGGGTFGLGIALALGGRSLIRQA